MADTETLTLQDGRELAYVRYGAPDGRPLYVFHGFPGCRLQAAFLHEQALHEGVCLVSPDRPGFGLSTFAAKRTLLDWPADVVQLAGHLGHTRFGVLGISCGGPYALACAHELPTRIDYVGLLAGMGPMDLPEIRRGQLPVLKLMFALARRQPWLISPLLMLDRAMFRRDAERAVKALSGMLTAPDRELLAGNRRVARDFGASLAEAYRQGVRGAMHEAHLIASERPFDMSRILMPVHVHQGGSDRNVPPEMGRHIAEQLPGGRFHYHEGDGHLSIVVNRFGACLREFAQAPRTAAAPAPAVSAAAALR